MKKWSNEKVLTVVLKVGVFVFLVVVVDVLCTWVLLPAGILIASTLGVFAAAGVANAVSMRIWEGSSLVDVGFAWNSAAVRNLLVGLGSGIVAAIFVVLGPLLGGVAQLTRIPEGRLEWPSLIFLIVVLLFGAIGEEMLFRGYGFQILMGILGPFATILPVAVMFALVHVNNPSVNWLGLVNTALWGVALGFAFWRSGDLWLPIGLHCGWNWVLPLFGANLSGFKMSVTGYTMTWRAGPLVSGGQYGPEGGLLTTAAVVLLILWLALKAPIRRQTPPLLAAHWEE